MGSKQLNDTESQVIRTQKGQEFYKHQDLSQMIASKTISDFNMQGSFKYIYHKDEDLPDRNPEAAIDFKNTSIQIQKGSNIIELK